MQLIKYFLVVFIMAVIITGAATWLTNKGLRQSKVDFYGTMNAASDTSKHTNIVIVGASRALVQLDTRIIDSATGLSSYNFGLNAASAKTCFNTMKYVLNYQKEVKLAILNVDFSIFNIAEDPYKDAYYYPFEKKLAGFIMSDTSSSRLVHKLKLFDISLYDDYTKYAAIDGLLRPQRKIEGKYSGYIPQNINSDFSVPVANPLKNNQVLDSATAFKYLAGIIELCKEKKVQLVFVVAPYYKECFPDKYFANYTALMQKTKQVAVQNNVLFLDYSAIPVASEKKYFYNCNHLNSTGAAIYTTIVADTLTNYLKIKDLSQSN
jgi:hypothetical protein